MLMAPTVFRDNGRPRLFSDDSTFDPKIFPAYVAGPDQSELYPPVIEGKDGADYYPREE